MPWSRPLIGRMGTEIWHWDTWRTSKAQGPWSLWAYRSDPFPLTIYTSLLLKGDTEPSTLPDHICFHHHHLLLPWPLGQELVTKWLGWRNAVSDKRKNRSFTKNTVSSIPHVEAGFRKEHMGLVLKVRDWEGQGMKLENFSDLEVLYHNIYLTAG